MTIVQLVNITIIISLNSSAICFSQYFKNREEKNADVKDY